MNYQIVFKGGKATLKKIYYGSHEELPKGYDKFCTAEEAKKKGQLRRFGLMKIPKQRESTAINRKINKLSLELAKLKGKKAGFENNKFRENKQKEKDEWQKKIDAVNVDIEKKRDELKELKEKI